MKQTTSVKLLTWLALTFFVPFLLGSGLIYWYEKKDRQETFVKELQERTQALSTSMSEPLAYFASQEALRIAQVVVFNHKNIVEIFVYSDVFQIPLVHIDIPRRKQGELLSCEQPVDFEGESVGKIRITSTVDSVIKDFFSPFFKKILAIFLGMSFIGFLSMWLAFRRYMVLPMSRLLDQTHKITQGTMTEPCVWEGDDEFATLGKTIEAMRQKIFARLREVYLEARTDELTGISNRRDFLERVERDLARCYEQKQPFSLMMFDLDEFKQINDQYGHSVGDQILNIVSLSLKQNLRNGDLFARWGGEEFLLALPGTSKNQAYLLAEKLRRVLFNTPYPKNVHVTASFGVLEAQGTESFQTLLDAADAAMYLAKKRGKNQVVIYDPDNTEL